MIDQEIDKLAEEAFARGIFFMVNLIREQATGRVLFCHRCRSDDYTSARELWPDPVGSAFGTYLEIWLATPRMSVRAFPPVSNF
jgi:hypothetical protein